MSNPDFSEIGKYGEFESSNFIIISMVSMLTPCSILLQFVIFVLFPGKGKLHSLKVLEQKSVFKLLPELAVLTCRLP